MLEAYDEYNLEQDGLTFLVEYHYDENSREPWKENEGHGVVSEWVKRPKLPHERILANDGYGNVRLYDIRESTVIALRDSWDCTRRRAEAEAFPDKPWSRREIAEYAVESDFEHLRAWCDDKWHWCGVVVTLLDTDERETNVSRSLWSIESDATEYLKEVAKELASEISAEIPEDGQLVIKVRK